MNYFEHHIGDYDEATSHLTAVEDGIYHRLLRKYYATEAPLLADVEKLQRLVRARTKEEKQAVVDMLAEFFTLLEDGWHQSTCDEVILDYHDAEPERELKKANEQARLKRHREERARLFKELHAADLHAPWNISMSDLRALVKRACNAPATPTGNVSGPEPATPLTATHLPLTTPQGYSVANATAPPGGAEAVDKPPQAVEPVDVIFAYGLPLLTAAGVAEPRARKMLGMMRKQHGDAAVVRAIERCAVEQAVEPVMFLQATLAAIVKKGNGIDAGPPWWSSNEGIDKKGRELGMQARGSESYADFKQRLFDRIRETEKTP